MNRTVNFTLAIICTFIFLIPILVTAVLVKLTSRGPLLHWSNRVGKNNDLFSMPKFRSMKTDTPQVATHLLQNTNSHLTPIGSLLRKSSLDELPQLWSILTGKMNFVGPRPALFNQYDLIEMRTVVKVHLLTPGITGHAQTNGRDSISLEEKVKLDEYYFNKRSFILDLKIIFRTITKVLNMDNITH